MPMNHHEVKLDDGRVMQGVKFTPPKHWVVQRALTIQTVSGPAMLVDDVVAGNRLHAINGMPVHDKQFSNVVEHLRGITGPLSLTIEVVKPRLASNTTIIIDTRAWTVKLPNGTSLTFPCLLLELLRETNIGLAAGDTLVAVNGQSGAGLNYRKMQKLLEGARHLSVVHLEWANHTPLSHNHHRERHGMTAWAILSEFYSMSKGQVLATKNASYCRLCEASFGLFKHKHKCTICGHMVCSTCQAKCVAVVSTIQNCIKYRACIRCAHLVSSYGYQINESLNLTLA
ncbi:hypothetical protein DYB37_000069 [Aphanomyces astaci]|uniref:FYVE-type domain-containing protein n=1 Tax=Aphanomyces astaci TaxID=112090 RepID=A0A396ZY40_APHAT|nr:hypothetical protein DYB36_002964 [Aphanomyces astaci]RHY91109.1 hypothetical protein DYB35_003638 [Aphanomyces astaci]RHZ34525.1 hypothetical protein DYB37_000069 [Aphanomyces astaci]RLO11496.1 hypothetical protein DYB28_004628 [Aphanomyces astaci]